MKVRLEEGMQLVITPENYVEQVALKTWVDTHQGQGGWLIEAYAQQSFTPDPPSAPKLFKSCINNEDGTFSFPAE